MLKVRQELYLKHQIRKKAQQDVGLFYCLYLLDQAKFSRTNLGSIMKSLISD